MSIPAMHIEIDKFDKNGWHNLLTQFNDASICQTWSYSDPAKRSVSSIVIKAGEEILGCCLVSLLRLPFSNLGIADIKWGPLCMKKGGLFKPDLLFHMIRAIKEEYAIKRGYLLRLWPHAIDERKELLKQILESEGFRVNPFERPYRTFKIGLSPSLDDLRKNFSQNWRRNLNKAEKVNLRVVEGTSDDLYMISFKLAQEMAHRKNLPAIVKSYKEFRRVQADLPETLKMKIMICEAGSEPVCSVVCSVTGDTGIYLLGASGEKALKLNASYLLQWHMIKWMKEKGAIYYDLGGFNPQRNPGGYQFKLGIAGKSGFEEVFLGEFHGCFNLSGQIAKLILDSWRFVDRLKEKCNRPHKN
jgi:hypothetical protein